MATIRRTFESGSEPLQQVMVLAATEQDFRWLQGLFASAAGQLQVTWCPQPSDFEVQFRGDSPDLVVWLNPYPEGSAAAHEDFLQLLLSAGDDCPLLVVGSADENSAARFWLSLGASDYLSRTELTPRTLLRAARASLLSSVARTGQAGDSGLEPGLINRNLFFDRIQQALDRCQQQGLQLALFHINIDSFRTVNESLGYQAGDQVVLAVAERLRPMLGQEALLMRIGGDDLAVVLEGIEDPDIGGFLGEVAEALSTPVQVASQSVLVTVSTGVALYPAAADNADSLLQQANRAMFEAKRDSGNSYRLYTRPTRRGATRQLQLESDLRHALHNNELELYFQPRLTLCGSRVAGVESLLRWHHPERGLVSPDVFIPVAERTGLIVPIGYWVIQQACARLREATALGFGDLVFAVNLSFRQFHDRRMTDTIFRIIFGADIETSLLELELTESAMMHDLEYAQRCLRELNGLGLSFALDDFGTGFSSLSHLQDLPISLVKVDKSFVQRLEHDEGAQHIVSAIVGLSHSLKKLVVAEGVETEAQLEFLRNLGCDQVQGFYYARPMPWQDLVLFLEQRRNVTALSRYRS